MWPFGSTSCRPDTAPISGDQHRQQKTPERRFSGARNERYRALATELANLNVDLIVAPGTPAAVAAKEATSTIPIVTMLVADPVGSRLIASLARPGGNVTGMSSAAADITAKQLELLKEVVPRLCRVVVFSNPTAAMHPRFLKDLEVAARTLRVRRKGHFVYHQYMHQLEYAETLGFDGTS